MRAVKICLSKDLREPLLAILRRYEVSANLHPVEHLANDKPPEERYVLDVETSTPKAKRLIDAIESSDLYDREKISISTRQPRAILSTEAIVELTRPWREPEADIQQELWQFSHLTSGLVARVAIAGGLLALGVIHEQLLLMISGMLFLPLVPVVMAIGVGSWKEETQLLVRAGATLLTALIVLFGVGMAVAAFSQGPVRFNDFASMPLSAAISFSVGVAAALANSDDGGRRELIGLAAAAQIAVIPVWLGVCLVLGFPVSDAQDQPVGRLATLLLNILMILAGSLATYIAIGAIRRKA